MMPTTTSFTDAVRLAEATAAAGGTVPARLGHLIASFEVLTAPARVDDPATAVLDAALSGKLTAAVLAKLLPEAAAKASGNAVLSS